ncbi:MAG: hypothetical protein EXR75_02460 [Myxococcales bacterium]|nr:hypothetical protein [Myxococcales bacterium]
MTLAHRLGQAAALLFLLGLLTGGALASAMTGGLDADVSTVVAAHLNALLGAFWIAAVAASLPLMRYGDVGLSRLALATVVPAYANWLITLVKAFLRVAGVSAGGSSANNAVFAALSVAVVVPSLVAATAWFLGFGPSKRAAG